MSTSSQPFSVLLYQIPESLVDDSLKPPTRSRSVPCWSTTIPTLPNNFEDISEGNSKFEHVWGEKLGNSKICFSFRNRTSLLIEVVVVVVVDVVVVLVVVEIEVEAVATNIVVVDNVGIDDVDEKVS